MQRQRQGRGRDHSQVAESQRPDIGDQQRPRAGQQHISGLLVVPRDLCEEHDGQADPEEVEEATEFVIIAPGVEIGDAGGIVDRVEDPPGSGLFPSLGQDVS